MYTEIQYWVTANHYGLIEEKIYVTNLSCSSQRHEISLVLFVDDSSLVTNLPLSETGIDWLRFDDVYPFAYFSMLIFYFTYVCGANLSHHQRRRQAKNDIYSVTWEQCA